MNYQRRFFVLLSVSFQVFLSAELHAQLPRTEFDHPNLQGIWYYGSATPMERPVELGSQQTYTPEQGQARVEALATQAQQNNLPIDPNRSEPEAGAGIAQEADHNFASFRKNLTYLDKGYRTSLIVSPNNGRYPYKAGYADYVQSLIAQGYGAFDGPEIRSVSERCTGPTAGPMPPMTGWFYNANMQIVQTKDYVMIMGELTHDARIITLNSSGSKLQFPQWMGYSVGHWEGDTLIVETTGFREEQSWWYLRMTEDLKVTERFRLIDENEIFYQFTMVDENIYTSPVTVEKNITRRAKGEYIYEYACHEGNYSLPSILAGARRQELDAKNDESKP